ncbi:hypothetical protein [Hymenobacter rubripertinctus]|uniref:Uncharacterized protein n=1 Tax=Hymenobacter rubripertinctus TaxID=2029981 RepID=A0A418R051_9BACT|nr:hypothetical protein [Hymenobacter rubripertinctus]RIY10807.1 hypothetical protein D0T11_09090 [Hymenobacter rubripertinctus]
MSTLPVSPFALARTFVFRRYLTVRHRLADMRLTADAIRQARQRRQQERHDKRMRDFYGWCDACRAFGSIF